MAPNSIYALEVCGGLLRQRSSSRKAASRFPANLTELDSSKLDAWLDLADSLRQDGRAQEAIDTLDKAADRFGGLRPRRCRAFRLPAGERSATKESARRRPRRLVRAIETAPASGIFDLLDALRQWQKYKRALAAIDDYLAKHDPAPFEVLVHKAQLLSDLGEFARRHEILRPIEKDDAAVFALRGWALEFRRSSLESGGSRLEAPRRIPQSGSAGAQSSEQA